MSNEDAIAKVESAEAWSEFCDLLKKAGDVLLFVDSTAHGSAPRTNEGERRFVLYRYGPNWGSSRCVLRFLQIPLIAECISSTCGERQIQIWIQS